MRGRDLLGIGALTSGLGGMFAPSPEQPMERHRQYMGMLNSRSSNHHAHQIKKERRRIARRPAIEARHLRQRHNAGKH